MQILTGPGQGWEMSQIMMVVAIRQYLVGKIILLINIKKIGQTVHNNLSNLLIILDTL